MSIRVVPFDFKFDEPCERLNFENQGLFFQSTKYKNFLIRYLGAKDESVVAVSDSNEIVGYFPILSQNGCFGRVLNSLPYFGSHGGIIAKDRQVRDALTSYYNDVLVKDQNVAASTVISSPIGTHSYMNLSHDLVDSRIGQVTRLDFDNEGQLFSKLHSKTRNMVRKALSGNFRITIQNSKLDFLYDTHVANMHAISGSPKERRFFDLIGNYFVPDEDYQIWTAEKGGKLAAALLLFFYNGTVEYFTPTIVEEFRSDQPLSAIIFSALKACRAKGFSRWNWGGTWATQEGVYRFKSRWGAEDLPYFYYTKVNNSALLESTVATLSSEYRNFYTIPYTSIRKPTSEVEAH